MFRRLRLRIPGGDHDFIAVRIKNNASDLVSLSFVMFLISQGRGAVGMWSCRHCTPVSENHQDDKASGDKIRQCS